MKPSNLSDTSTSSAGTSTQTGAGAAIASAGQGLKENARDAAARLKSTAATTASRAREEAEKIAQEKKSTVADRIGGYSNAIHESARSLEEQDPNVAWFTHRAADRLQHMSEYLRSRSFSDFRYDAEDVARRHPALFFGGLFVAGLLVGNLMKASSRARSSSSELGYGSDEDVSDWAASASGTSTSTEPAPTGGI